MPGMKIAAYLEFAKSLLFPKSEKSSSARRSLTGSIVCIGISLVPLVIVSAMSNGLIKGMTERIIGLSSSHIQAYVARSQDIVGSWDSYNEYANQFLEEDGVRSVYPEISSSALASGNDYRSGAMIRGVQNDIFEKNDAFNNLLEITEGDIEKFKEGGKVCAIGQKLSESLSLHPGDKLKVITTKNLNGKVTPKLTVLNIIAVVSSGYQELDALWVFVPAESAFTFLPLKSSTFSIMIETEDPFSAELSKTRRELQAVYGKSANFYTWNEVNAAQFENFSSTRVMLLFVMILIVLVACVNISSALVMLVMERRREIAVLKSVGAKNSGISFSFTLAGTVAGFLGVCIGLPVGILLSLKSNEIVLGIEKMINFFARLWYGVRGLSSSFENIKLMDPAYYMSTIPVTVPVKEILIMAAVTVLLSMLVSLVPSIKAGKEDISSLFTKN